VFWLGVIYPVGNLEKIFPASTAIYSEISLNRASLKNLQALFPDADITLLWSAISGDKFAFDFEKDIKPWVGSRAGIGVFGKGDFVVAVQYRNRAGAEKFLDHFRLPSEAFDISDAGGGEIWTPKFSSNFSFGFAKGYVFFASSPARLKEVFEFKTNLRDSEAFNSIRSDLQGRGELFLFADTQKALDILLMSGNLQAQKPMMEVLSQTLPALGVRAKLDKTGIQLDSKILTREGVFAGKRVERGENKTLPELAQFASQNALFFMNGADIHAKYLHTKEFLSSFHPQFAVVFDGVLRGLSRQIFGEKFDFEKDFLSQMHGQYALILDFPDVLSPFVNFTLITGFGEGDTEQNISHLHDALRFAQGQFSAESREVKLPDGSMREELVAVPSQELPIKKKEFNGATYFTFDSPSDQNKKFSYGFLEGYFIFSTHEDGLKSVISAYGGENLAKNQDFRDSVLFRFSPSESYGFLNYTKLSSVFELLGADKTEENTVWSFFAHANVRNLVFARKVFPSEIFWTAILFKR